MASAKYISNVQQYEAALRRIYALMDAVPGTARGSELDRLATMVERYERRHFPIGLPEPLEAIRFREDQSKTEQ